MIYPGCANCHIRQGSKTPYISNCDHGTAKLYDLATTAQYLNL